MKIPSEPRCPDCQLPMHTNPWSDAEYVFRCANETKFHHQATRYDIYYQIGTNVITSVVVLIDNVLLFANYYSDVSDVDMNRDEFFDITMNYKVHRVDGENIRFEGPLNIDWFDLEAVKRKIKMLLVFQ